MMERSARRPTRDTVERSSVMNALGNERPPKQPLEDPELGPKGPRTPYPVDEPIDPKGPGSEPDYFPGKPGSEVPNFKPTLRVRRARKSRVLVSWLQAH
jgi:hypothetical protein